MEFKEVHISLYDSFFKTKPSIFLEGFFYIHNTPEADFRKIHAFVGVFEKEVVGIVGKIEDGKFQSPYMASYGGFRSDVHISYEKTEWFVARLVESLKGKGIKGIEISFAPDVYFPSMNSNLKTALKQHGFCEKYTELNQYFELSDFSESLDYLNDKDQKNTHNALKRNMFFEITGDDVLKEDIYFLFQKSREERNIPLKMTWEKIKHVSKFMSMDFWAVFAPEGQLCAGAIIYRVSNDLCQVVYWGFDSAYTHLDSMRYLAFQIFKYYKSLNMKMIDIGISTEYGVPNKGLIAFKENIGCKSCDRVTMAYLLPD